MEQGIWRIEWDRVPTSSWKHEVPIEADCDLKSVDIVDRLGFPQARSDEEAQQFAEQRVVLMRQREASRPFHQFIVQVSKEQNYIQNSVEISSGAADIGTRAYENVKSTWIRQKIWSRKWITIPGGMWKHEEPLDESDVISPPPTQPAFQENETRDTPRVFNFLLTYQRQRIRDELQMAMGRWPIISTIIQKNRSHRQLSRDRIS